MLQFSKFNGGASDCGEGYYSVSFPGHQISMHRVAPCSTSWDWDSTINCVSPEPPTCTHVLEQRSFGLQHTQNERQLIFCSGHHDSIADILMLMISCMQPLKRASKDVFFFFFFLTTLGQQTLWSCDEPNLHSCHVSGHLMHIRQIFGFL